MEAGGHGVLGVLAAGLVVAAVKAEPGADQEVDVPQHRTGNPGPVTTSHVLSVSYFVFVE